MILKSIVNLFNEIIQNLKVIEIPDYTPIMTSQAFKTAKIMRKQGDYEMMIK